MTVNSRTDKFWTYVIVASPHGSKVTPDNGGNVDWDEGEGHQVDQCGQKKVEHWEMQEHDNQAQYVA